MLHTASVWLHLFCPNGMVNGEIMNILQILYNVAENSKTNETDVSKTSNCMHPTFGYPGYRQLS